MQFLRFVIISLAVSAVVFLGVSGASQAQARRTPRRLNVLFISIDDLRPNIGAYGDPVAVTPNLDRLARRGITFNRAYCQQAVCSPSRVSILTGRRPDTTGVYDLQADFRTRLPDVVTLPQHFKQHGYHTQQLSKIFHNDDSVSWSVPSWASPGRTYGTNVSSVQSEINKGMLASGAGTEDQGRPFFLAAGPLEYKGPSWEAPDVPDDTLKDGQTARKAIETLREIKDRAFFLGVGFLRPHLPFVAPKKYYDLYSSAKLKSAPNPFPPKNVPPIALFTGGELRTQYTDTPRSGPLSNEKARQLIHGYYASISYIDAQIGRVLAELDRLGLRDNTIIVVWSDHGYQLGEHGLWDKYTNFEVATRTPLIISLPREKRTRAHTDALVEFVDIYPTLSELAGLPLPQGLEGTSFVPLIKRPRMKWKDAAFSQYPRGRVMGRSMRTDRYRYTEWRADGAEVVGVELYDHRIDPLENINIAYRSEHKQLIVKLSARLHAGWQAALPQSNAIEAQVKQRALQQRWRSIKSEQHRS